MQRRFPCQAAQAWCDVLTKSIAEEATDSNVPAATLNFERFETAMFQRDYAEAARYLAQIPGETFGQDAFFMPTPVKPTRHSISSSICSPCLANYKAARFIT